MGQVMGNDGRPAFGVAYDVTEVDAEGRPVFKVYFGSASAWFVKNVYHAKWNDLREVKRELEPESPGRTDGSSGPRDRGAPAPNPDAPRGKEAGRNPRDRARAEQQQHGGGQGGGGGRHRGRRGGRGRR
jgi:hypothetical protein